jgi:hypothetical protein
MVFAFGTFGRLTLTALFMKARDLETAAHLLLDHRHSIVPSLIR